MIAISLYGLSQDLDTFFRCIGLGKYPKILSLRSAIVVTAHYYCPCNAADSQGNLLIDFLMSLSKAKHFLRHSIFDWKLDCQQEEGSLD